jgi:hypothetical protein
MSASTRSVPAQVGLGRFPSALAGLALVVILAVAVAIVALNGTKAAAPATDGAKGAPPPAVIDHGSSNGETVILPKTNSQFGGWGGPRIAPDSQWNPAYVTPALKGPVYLGDNSKDDRNILSNPPYTGGAPRGVGSRAQ